MDSTNTNQKQAPAQTPAKPALRRTQRKFHGPAIWRIKEVYSPLHKDFRGLRLQVAIPNMAGHKAFSSEAAPSFNRPYLLLQSSDYNSDEVERKTKAHIQWLLNRGFTSVEHADTYAQRISAEMAKGRQVTHKEMDEVA